MRTRSRARREAEDERVGVTTRSMAKREAALAPKANITKRTPRGRLARKPKIVERRWPTLLPELLGAISDRLPIRDLVAFRSVCEGWRAAPCGRSAMFKFSKSTPWLIIYGTTMTANTYNHHHSEDPRCFLYHPKHHESCTLKLPSLHGATCLESKLGWLLAHRNGRLFLSNPFSLETIHLPPYPRMDPTSQIFTFVSLPTSRKCTVFAVSCKGSTAIQVGMCSLQSRKWETRDLVLNDTLFGPIREVLCCNCSDDKVCSCSYPRDSGLYCFDTKRGCLIYPVLGDGNWHMVSTGEQRYTNLFEELSGTHSTEWLQRFGGKGIKLSTCGLSTKMEGYPGIRRCHYGVGVGVGGSGDGIHMVDGVFVEPRF